MKLRSIPIAAAALLAGFAAAPAGANLIPLGAVQLQGQGIGAVLTALTLQAKGASTTESGYIDFTGATFGDALTGASQSRTFTLADLGLVNATANQLALIVNLAEPGSETPPSVTATSAGSFSALASRIALNVYSAAGVLLQTFTLASNMVLLQDQAGVGGSGLVFGLDAVQGGQLATLLNTTGTEVFTVGATFADAQGGVDTIQAARLTAAVPEPAAYVLMLAGLGAIGFMARRRRMS